MFSAALKTTGINCIFDIVNYSFKCTVMWKAVGLITAVGEERIGLCKLQALTLRALRATATDTDAYVKVQYNTLEKSSN